MTTAGIAREFGGAKAVLQKDVMLKWLKENNEKPENFVQAQNNFMRSCAAYCVAT
jgi:phosphatidylinositol kinase/protein kinase (PI-3  family)